MHKGKLNPMLRKAKSEGWADRIRSENDERAVLSGCRFDENSALHIVAFFEEFLRHGKGEWAGKPFTLLDWQRYDVIEPLFGWLRADGTRRFRRAYLEVPKKNGKSTLAAGVSLYLLVGDGEMGAEVYSAAADRDQASIVFREAASMVGAAPELTRACVVRRSTKTIAFEQTGSFYRALSADVPTKEGLNISALIFDELHAQRSRDLWDALVYGGGSRKQPLFLSITTAGYDRHSICWEQHEYAKRVIEGTLPDEAFFGYIRAAEDDDDWTDPAIWKKANPSFDVTVSAEAIAEDCREAQESPAKENAFRRYHLNQWTEQAVRWLSMERWDGCCESFDIESLWGRDCFLGVDLATTTDIAAAVLLFPESERASASAGNADDPQRGDAYIVVPHFFAPKENARRRERRDGVPYVRWANEGLLELTEGDVIDYRTIRKRIREWADDYNILEIAYDPYNAEYLCNQQLGQEDGFTTVPIRQGMLSMSPPTKELEKLILSRKLIHNGNPILRWMTSNVTVRTDVNANIMPDKKKSTDRIDGVVATIIALARAMVHQDEASVYETRGFITL